MHAIPLLGTFFLLDYFSRMRSSSGFSIREQRVTTPQVFF